MHSPNLIDVEAQAQRREIIYHTPYSFPGSSVSKKSACNLGDPGSVHGLGRSAGEGNGKPLQYPFLETSMDRGAQWAAVHGVAKSRPGLTDTQMLGSHRPSFPSVVVLLYFWPLLRLTMRHRL